jgi:hypothetical protein
MERPPDKGKPGDRDLILARAKDHPGGAKDQKRARRRIMTKKAGRASGETEQRIRLYFTLGPPADKNHLAASLSGDTNTLEDKPRDSPGRAIDR